MSKINLNLHEFDSKVIKNLKIVSNHIDRLVELTDELAIDGLGEDFSEKDKLEEMITDCQKIREQLKELEQWSVFAYKKTKSLLDEMYYDAKKLPLRNIQERIGLSRKL